MSFLYTDNTNSTIHGTPLPPTVRQKTKDLVDLIQDDDRLREDRKKARKNKDKYIDMSGHGDIGGAFHYSE